MAGKTDYKNNWQKENADRVNLVMPKGQKAAIKAHADNLGESVNGFINRAIEEARERDGAQVFGVMLKCPKCGHKFVANLGEYVSDSVSYERQMGAETEHTIDAEINCPQCQEEFSVSGSIWEYPEGAQNYVEIQCSELE